MGVLYKLSIVVTFHINSKEIYEMWQQFLRLSTCNKRLVSHNEQHIYKGSFTWPSHKAKNILENGTIYLFMIFYVSFEDISPKGRQCVEQDSCLDIRGLVCVLGHIVRGTFPCPSLKQSWTIFQLIKDHKCEEEGLGRTAAKILWMILVK